jgi:hypothetical protein
MHIRTPPFRTNTMKMQENAVPLYTNNAHDIPLHYTPSPGYTRLCHTG